MFSLHTATYDVQSLTLKSLSNGLNVSCAFLEGSNAHSCVLILCNSSDDVCEQSGLVLPRDMPSKFLKTTQCWYIDKVLEIESDGTRTTVDTAQIN